KKLGPSLLDVDDWHGKGGKNMTFYVMEYIEGESIHRYIRKHGYEWMGVFVLQLLDSLEALHQAGWVFGDFKTDNLIITKSPVRVRWIDVGGTTQMGRAIKEYTAFYDRAHWGLGSRRAEASYDLFALVMTVLHVCYPKHFARGSHPEQTLSRRLRAIKPLHIYYKPFKKAIDGRYQTSREMRDEIKTVMQQAQKKKGDKQRHSSVQMQSIWTESAGIFLLAGVYYLVSFLF
ncbi:MAG TPA: protein kinase family protein, partial [Bacillota bacterium]|nr:protein kinase family protein [Bacillota bacterium]